MQPSNVCEKRCTGRCRLRIPDCAGHAEEVPRQGQRRAQELSALRAAAEDQAPDADVPEEDLS